MSIVPASEALLISALLHRQDVEEAARYGVSEHHFNGYSREYTWLKNYLAVYNTQPSIDAFLKTFPDFPLADHEDVRWAADQVLEGYFTRLLTGNIQDAMEALQRNNIAEAYSIVRKYEYTQTSALPVNLITDTSFLDDFDQQETGIEVPYPTLQHATGGIRPGNLWYLAARLGQGKSAYLADIATHAMMSGKRVLYYSLEMTAHELRSRVHPNLSRRVGWTGLPFYAREILNRTVDRHSYKTFITELPDKVSGVLNIHTPADGVVTPSVVASRAEEHDLVIVDYATLMHTDSGTPASKDWREATEISNRLKQVALSTGTPILAAAQINRDSEIGDGPPRVKNLAQADALGQDGDVVVTLRSMAQRASTVFSLEKNRHGPSGVRWWTRFDVNQGLFEEITEDRAIMLDDEAASAKDMS